jgi:hypothetical protein
MHSWPLRLLFKILNNVEKQDFKEAAHNAGLFFLKKNLFGASPLSRQQSLESMTND